MSYVAWSERAASRGVRKRKGFSEISCRRIAPLEVGGEVCYGVEEVRGHRMRRHIATLLLLALAACSDRDEPMLFVTNATGTPLEIIAYDYSIHSNGPPGFYTSPSFMLGRVNSASACLTLAPLPSVADEFALDAEEPLKGVGVEGGDPRTFVPQNALGWSVTFDTLPVGARGPMAMTNACTP
jgi:hypothetical protein